MSPVSNVRPGDPGPRDGTPMHQFVQRLHILYGEVEQFRHLVAHLMQELAGYETAVGAPQSTPDPVPDEEHLRAYV